MNDLSGKTIDNWTVLRFSHRDETGAYYLCLCECGNIEKVLRQDITKKKIKKCSSGVFLCHPLWETFQSLKSRCYNQRDIMFQSFGGRGISVYPEWRNNFQTFFDFVKKIGWQKGKRIERRNKNGNFEPNNCYIARG